MSDRVGARSGPLDHDLTAEVEGLARVLISGGLQNLIWREESSKLGRRACLFVEGGGMPNWDALDG